MLVLHGCEPHPSLSLASLLSASSWVVHLTLLHPFLHHQVARKDRVVFLGGDVLLTTCQHCFLYVIKISLPDLKISLSLSLSLSFLLPFSTQICSSPNKLAEILEHLPPLNEDMQKRNQPFKLKLCQRLADPGSECSRHFLHVASLSLSFSLSLSLSLPFILASLMFPCSVTLTFGQTRLCHERH